MTTNFVCPKCKSRIKVGRLRSTYTCSRCNYGMLITRDEKIRGRKIFKKSV